MDGRVPAAVASPLTPVVFGRRRVFCCHRANHGHPSPGNSLPAIAACIEARVPRLEVDLRFLADDSLLVFHDGELDAETDGAGPVAALDAATARTLRYRSEGAVGLCFLDEVVEIARSGSTVIQVDLKLAAPLSAGQVRRLVAVLAPLGELALVGSQAYWNLRPLADTGLRVALDPTLEWHYNPAPTPAAYLPGRTGIHGLRDDAPIAHLLGIAAHDYFQARLRDLLGLVPAVEWMVDHHTLLRMADLGFDLGNELARFGIELAAWTVNDAGPATTPALLRRLFELGTTTVITDDASSLARYAAAL